MSSLKNQVLGVLSQEQETSIDQIIVQIFGGSLIAEGQMNGLQQAINELLSEGKVERTLLGIKRRG